MRYDPRIGLTYQNYVPGNFYILKILLNKKRFCADQMQIRANGMRSAMMLKIFFIFVVFVGMTAFLWWLFSKMALHGYP